MAFPGPFHLGDQFQEGCLKGDAVYGLCSVSWPGSSLPPKQKDNLNECLPE